MTTRSPLRYERDGAVAILTLDRAEVLNAFNEGLTEALNATIADCAADTAVRAVVITGAGRAFSAGQDLDDRLAMIEKGGDLRLGDELRRRYHPVIAAIRTMRKPVIAAVNGVAAGAGLGLAVACDVRVAAASASFRAAWGRVGLVPDAGSAFFLPRLVGWGRALDMVLTGEPVNADTALSYGLATRVWPDEVFVAKWHEYAQTLARGATEAFALTKEGLNAAMARGFEEFLDVEAGLQDSAGRTGDYARGVRAFAAKRSPEFEGH